MMTAFANRFPAAAPALGVLVLIYVMLYLVFYVIRETLFDSGVHDCWEPEPPVPSVDGGLD